MVGEVQRTVGRRIQVGRRISGHKRRADEKVCLQLRIIDYILIGMAVLVILIPIVILIIGVSRR